MSHKTLAAGTGNQSPKLEAFSHTETFHTLLHLLDHFLSL
jgi:hypothetical protein